MDLTVEQISPEQTHPLRMAVLRPGRPAAECVFPGDDDPKTLHVGAMQDGEVLAIASLYREARPDDAPGRAPVGPAHTDGTAWRLRGMATAPEARRQGAGLAALRAVERHAREQGGTLAWCNARVGAVAFYEAAGWTVLGEEFDIPTVGPHFVMERALA